MKFSKSLSWYLWSAVSCMFWSFEFILHFVLIDVSSNLIISSSSTIFSVKPSFHLKSGVSVRKLSFHPRHRNPSSFPYSKDVLPSLYAYPYPVYMYHALLCSCPDVSANSVSFSMVFFLVLFLCFLLLPIRIKLQSISEAQGTWRMGQGRNSLSVLVWGLWSMKIM